MNQPLLFRPRALIVEDESIVAMEIQDQLEALGWDACGVAATGEEAIRLAAAGRPDLILMDITLRGAMSGIEAAEKILALRAVPIIFLTATVDEKIAARIRALDAEAVFLGKPFAEEELRRETERIRIRLSG
ncbi:MAG: response regulator [Candidatus Aminicenantes bacterium]|nr:response regulator [Candidatus Aminicenantes bacterium]